MKKTALPAFAIIGIAVRTTNENNQAATDIPALWSRFMSENIFAKIPNRISDDIYSVYTEYEKDFTKPYTTILGCKVLSLENIPNGMIGKAFAEETYIQFTAKGNLSQGVVYTEWEKIWNSGIDRKYTADFEIYGEKAQNPETAEVPIFIAVP